MRNPGLAQHPFFGLHTSHVRTIKLDTIASLTALIQKLDIRGPVLDVGCGVGYMTIWLARQFPLQFVGVDGSPRSIEIARSRASGVGNVRFDCFGYVRKPFGQKSDFILCASGLSDRAESGDVVRNIARSLVDGGVCVLTGGLDEDLDYDALKQVARDYRLGFAFWDKVGGWKTPEVGYEYADFIVLVKSVNSPLPAKFLANSVELNNFLRYSKLADVPREEQSIGYYRAKRSEGKLPPDTSVEASPQRA